MCLVLCAVSASAKAQTVLDNGCRQYAVDACHRDTTRRFYVTAGAETFYVWNDVGAYSTPELCLWVTAPGLPIVLGRYVKLGGETVELRFESSDPSIVSHLGAGRFAVKGAGRVVLSVTVADARVDVPVQVIALPVSDYTKTEEIIATLGLPDRVTKEYVPWPQNRVIDNVFYGKRDDGKDWRVHHWLYDAYPGLVIALDDNDCWPRALYNETWEIVRRYWVEQNY